MREVLAQRARARGWTNERAQEELNTQSEELDANAAMFLEQLQAHPEVGGAKLADAQASALAVLDRALPKGSPERAALDTWFDSTGAGNHPVVMLLLSRIGKHLREDTPPPGGAPAGGTLKSDAEVLFGKNTPARP